MRGDDAFEAGIPESFNVLVKEMKALGLNVELEQFKDDEDEAVGSDHEQLEDEKAQLPEPDAAE